MRSFLKKRKANKIKKLKVRVIELEDENSSLRKEIFQYRLKRGKNTPRPKRRVAKLMGNHGTQSAGPE